MTGKITVLLGALLVLAVPPSLAKKCRVKEDNGALMSREFRVAVARNDQSTFRYFKIDSDVLLESSLLLSGLRGTGPVELTVDTPMRLVSESETLTVYPISAGEAMRMPGFLSRGLLVLQTLGNRLTKAYYVITGETIDWILTHPVTAFEIEFIHDGKLSEKIYPTSSKQQELFLFHTMCINEAM